LIIYKILCGIGLIVSVHQASALMPKACTAKRRGLQNRGSCLDERVDYLLFDRISPLSNEVYDLLTL